MAPGAVEGLVNFCPALTTVPAILVLGVVEVVTTLGELVLTPVEGLANLCAVLVMVDGVLGRGVDNL